MTGARPLAGTLAALVLAAPLAAQQYRLRLDTRVQGASYRGVVLDSILASDTVTGPGGGPGTPDGYAVTCVGADPYCTYFRPGPERRGGPLTTVADLTLWGLGVRGLSLHSTARLGTDLGDADVWPGTAPAVQLLKGYLAYASERVTARAGRQTVFSRFGAASFDGGRIVLRRGELGFDVGGYAGWGLARGAAIPVTSPALDPLDDFQPRERQLVAGAAAGWTSARADARVEYQREVDPRSDYFVSERVGLQASVRPMARLSVTGGADYDLAAGWWGSAEAHATYATPRVTATIGGRRYRPHFDLWTIWGAFSPVPYHAIHGRASVRLHRLVFSGRVERYVFDDAEAETPLADAEDRGWRWELGATATPRGQWTVDLGYHREFGPGAASGGLGASVTFAPSDRLTVVARAAGVARPLEFRFGESDLRVYRLEAWAEPRSRLRVSLGGAYYTEERGRPDAAAFDWDQVRLHAGVLIELGRGADAARLPEAIRRLPSGRTAR